MATYQQGYPYISSSASIPGTGSFWLNTNTWADATTIKLHDVPFESFGSSSAGTVITGSSDLNFESQYSVAGAGSILFANFSGSTWSWNVDSNPKRYTRICPV